MYFLKREFLESNGGSYLDKLELHIHLSLDNSVTFARTKKCIFELSKNDSLCYGLSYLI